MKATMVGSPPRFSRKSKMSAFAPFTEVIADSAVRWHTETSGNELSFT